MADNYFVNQYAPMNNIDPHSDESIRLWLDTCAKYYALEIGRFFNVPKEKEVLDLGCGIGGTIYYLHQTGYKNVTGVDKSEDQLAICRKFVAEQVIHADAIEYLKSTSQKYDYIIAFDLIEHLPKLQIPEFCHLLYQSLKPEGAIIIKTPNMSSLIGLRSRYLDFTHEVGFTEESIQQIFTEAGFRRVEVHNSFIGRKRLLLAKFYHRLVDIIYGNSSAKVITPNLVVVAKK